MNFRIDTRFVVDESVRARVCRCRAAAQPWHARSPGRSAGDLPRRGGLPGGSGRNPPSAGSARRRSRRLRNTRGGTTAALAAAARPAARPAAAWAGRCRSSSCETIRAAVCASEARGCRTPGRPGPRRRTWPPCAVARPPRRTAPPAGSGRRRRRRSARPFGHVREADLETRRRARAALAQRGERARHSSATFVAEQLSGSSSGISTRAGARATRRCRPARAAGVGRENSSSSSERTKLTCTPSPRWRPEHWRQITVPCESDAHVGSRSPQSAHRSLPGSARSALISSFVSSAGGAAGWPADLAASESTSSLARFTVASTALLSGTRGGTAPLSGARGSSMCAGEIARWRAGVSSLGPITTRVQKILRPRS